MKNISDEEILFPHKDIRKIQDQLVTDCVDVLNKNQSLIAHAPTGLGKTAAALGPALAYAIKNKLTVFFLTSRHTQHKIVVETLKMIKDKYSLDFITADIIGKQWMCAQDNVESMFSIDFHDYCTKLVEDNQCEFYLNTKKSNSVTPNAKKFLEEMKPLMPLSTDRLIELAKEKKLCPYEISILFCRKASVVIADYYYLFHPHIQDGFLKKISKKLDESILIVDEGHNLPGRIRELATQRLTTSMLTRAIKEAKKLKDELGIQYLAGLLSIVTDLAGGLKPGDERAVSKIADYDEIVESLEYLGELVREKQRQSYTGSIARFLQEWSGTDEGYTRFLSFQDGNPPRTILTYRCLDPGLLTKPTLGEVLSTIIMSGTLMPTEMYNDILGFPDGTVLRSYNDPFPKKNRLSMIVPETTTKFSKRSDKGFRHIADVTTRIINSVPGNVIVYFPSYIVQKSVARFFSGPVFTEKPLMTAQQKKDLLMSFIKKKGSVLFAVIGANYAEGIDISNNIVKGVIVVGLPLQKPNIESKALIEYFDKKFSRGWDYGYLFPAFNKILQGAGRCIRSETDKGTIVFLDERYAWNSYKRCFPEDSGIVLSGYFEEDIKNFFKKHVK